jgi:hypothetical protein
MTLTSFERGWAAAAMEAIFPGRSDLGLSDIRAMNVDGFLRELMAHLPLRAAVGVRLAVWLVAFAPLFVLTRFATIAGLPRQDRERTLGTLIASPSYVVRSLVLILKAMGALLYAADGGVRTRMTPPRPPAIAQLRIVVGRPLQGGDKRVPVT